MCRVSISVQVASRVSQLPLRGAAVSNQGQNRPSKHQKVSLTPLLVGFINGIDPKQTTQDRKLMVKEPRTNGGPGSLSCWKGRSTAEPFQRAGCGSIGPMTPPSQKSRLTENSVWLCCVAT